MARLLYYDVEVTAEEEQKLIEQVAEKIHEYGMETAAILMLESSKPLVWVGGEMGRFFITPFIPIISDKWGVKSEKFFLTFEKRENIEKLLTRLEDMARSDKKPKEKIEEKKEDTSEVAPADKSEEKTEPQKSSKEERKGWRRYIPF